MVVGMSADSGSVVEGAMATVANNYFQGALEERKRRLVNRWQRLRRMNGSGIC